MAQSLHCLYPVISIGDPDIGGRRCGTRAYRTEVHFLYPHRLPAEVLGRDHTVKKRMALIVLIGTTLLAERSRAADCSELPAWNNSDPYGGGTEVQHNGNAYRANWWNQNQDPETHSGQWEEWTLLGPCDGISPPVNQPPVANANGPYTTTTDTAVNFSSSGSSDPDGLIAAYQWSFGDGNQSSAPNPSHTYAGAGTYTVTLTVTDDDGASSIASTTVTVSGDGGPDACSGLLRYVAGTAYTEGQRVFNLRAADNQNVEYRCVVAGWCSSEAAWAYEPGNGAHWDDAWDEVGPCGGGGPQDPVANANGPYFGVAGNSIAFSSTGSSDPDGAIVAYDWSFGDGARSDAAGPSHTYATAGTYAVTLTVIDNDGRTNTASTIATVAEPGGGGTLPRRLLVGYWHNFVNPAGYLPIGEVRADWDIVNLAFAENDPFGEPGEVAFAPAEESDAAFRAGVQMLQARGQKVLISLGGANAYIQLNTAEERDNFVRTMGDIIAGYGLDGMDIDLEGSSINMTADDTVADPRTPAIVNLIDATRSLKARFGPSFVLTMAPETAYVQGGYATFGGIWGAYLPLIHALRNDLTVLHVQHYNTGSITGTDEAQHQPATVNFHVALCDMMITGFPAGRDPNNFFPGLRPDQVAFGLPASAGAANSGQTPPAVVHQALDCLIKRANCGSYLPAQAHSDFRGLMTWSITWDAASDFGFSGPHRAYLDANP